MPPPAEAPQPTQPVPVKAVPVKSVPKEQTQPQPAPARVRRQHPAPSATTEPQPSSSQPPVLPANLDDAAMRSLANSLDDSYLPFWDGDPDIDPPSPFGSYMAFEGRLAVVQLLRWVLAGSLCRAFRLLGHAFPCRRPPC